MWRNIKREHRLPGACPSMTVLPSMGAEALPEAPRVEPISAKPPCARMRQWKGDMDRSNTSPRLRPYRWR